MSDPKAEFERLLAELRPRLHRYCARMTGSVIDGEDVLQEAMIKAIEAFPHTGPLSNAEGWLFRIAHNLLIDDVRRKSHDALLHASKHQAKEDDDHIQRIADDLLPPDVTIEKQEVAELIERLLDEIPADQRETFTMHHFQDLSLPDIADAMDVPLATCKSRLRLAREKLSEKLVLRGFTPAPATSP